MAKSVVPTRPNETADETAAARLHAQGFTVEAAHVGDDGTATFVLTADDFTTDIADAVAAKLPPLPRRLLDDALSYVRSRKAESVRERQQAACDAAVTDWRETAYHAELLGSERRIVDWLDAAAKRLDLAEIVSLGKQSAAFIAQVEAADAELRDNLRRLESAA